MIVEDRSQLPNLTAFLLSRAIRFCKAGCRRGGIVGAGVAFATLLAGMVPVSLGLRRYPKRNQRVGGFICGHD